MSKGLKANEWVGQVQTLINGKGGGKDMSAQATGTNTACVQEAMATVTRYAAEKLGVKVAAQPAAAAADAKTQSSSDLDLQKLNNYLAKVSYISGYEPSQSDVCILNALGDCKPECDSTPHIYRWHKHMTSYAAGELKSLLGPAITVDKLGFAVSKKGDSDDDDDDDFDLFGEDEDAEETRRIREVRTLTCDSYNSLLAAVDHEVAYRL